MSETKNISPIDTGSVSKGAQRARYIAYMQSMRKLEQKVNAKKEGREKATGMGGRV